jgi:AcrR family transcriptional regulator
MGMGTTLRKERERLAKRQGILKAARQVFAAKGLHAATLDEIAEKAEFAKGTLYGYFESKDDLFVSMLEEEIVHLQDSLTAVISRGLPPTDTLAQLVKAMMQTFAQNMDLMRLLSQERSALTTCKGDQIEKRFLPRFHKLNLLVSSLVRRGIDQGAFQKVDPDRTATAIFNLCHGSAMSSFLNRKKVDNPEDVKFITGLLLDGIAAREIH